MICSMLGEVTDYELWQRAVRNQFRHGESVGSFLLGVGILVAIVVAVLVIARLQSRWNDRQETAQEDSHPQRLYTHLICALGFQAAQRQLLEALAKASTLSHPSALLMSEALFDRSVSEWKIQAGEADIDSEQVGDPQALAAVRSRLFPEGRGMVQSATVKIHNSHE